MRESAEEGWAVAGRLNPLLSEAVFSMGLRAQTGTYARLVLILF